MLRNAHKQLLKALAKAHEKDLRNGLALTRATFGESHVHVRELQEQIDITQETLHVLDVDVVTARAAA